MFFVFQSEYVSRALEVLSRTPVANLGNALETLDVTQHSLGYSVVSIFKFHEIFLVQFLRDMNFF